MGTKNPNSSTPRTTRQTKTADVAGAVAQRAKKFGSTIRLKAIAKGYYGLTGQVADLRQPGDVFQFAVKDLVPVKDEKAFADAQYADGTPKRAIEVNNTRYELPSWCVDPNVATPEDDELEGESAADEGDSTDASADAESASNQDVI